MWQRTVPVLLIFFVTFGVTACDLVPKEAVELSNTVGRDLEQVHRAHRALAELHFSQAKAEINRFVDETYRPAFIAKFAAEYQLDKKVHQAMETSPDELLGGLTSFVRISHERIERKRQELLGPVERQEANVIREIDEAYRQIQAAQAVVTGHLASVRKVREVQNEILAKVGLEGSRERIAEVTSKVSNKVAELNTIGVEIEAEIDKINAERDASKEAFLSAAEILELRLKAMDEKIEEVGAAIGG